MLMALAVIAAGARGAPDSPRGSAARRWLIAGPHSYH